MIEFTKEAYLFCIIAGLVIYFSLLILTVLIILLVKGLKTGKFLKSRRFLFSAIFGMIVFPCLSVLAWQAYLLHSFHSTVNKLKTCDHIEILLQPSLFFCLSKPFNYADLYSFVDSKFLKTYPLLIVEDKNIIKSFAYKLIMADYTAFKPGEWPCCCPGVPYIAIFKNGRQIGDLSIVHGRLLTTGRFSSFEASEDLTYWILRNLPETRPIAMRVSCAKKLEWLGQCLQSYTVDNDGRYPPPEFWCDLLTEPGRKPDGGFLRVHPEEFRCQAAGLGRCHYAINPFCTPQSPNDVILLFETGAGWNQHGGPERMAFDHHEPNGCNVLLNDGTIRFITPDTVADLKWKSSKKKHKNKS